MRAIGSLVAVAALAAALPAGAHAAARDKPAEASAPTPPSDEYRPIGTQAERKAAYADTAFMNEGIEQANARTAALCEGLIKHGGQAADARTLATYFRRVHTDLALLRSRYPSHASFLDAMDKAVDDEQRGAHADEMRAKCQK